MKRPVDAYDVILCDLDGCLIAGERVLPGAREFVSRFRSRLWILSNNSTDTPASLERRLVRLGIEVPENRIVLAGSLALDAVAQRKSKPRLAVFGSDALRAYAASRGLETQSASPDCILLARDLAFDFLALTRLIGHLTDGAELIVTNEDTTHPGADGRLVPETGALLAAVRSCLPGIAYTCFGKPHAAMYQTVLERGGVEPGSALAIGDNPATDGLGAKTAGIDFVLVGPLSGRFPALAAVLE